MNSKEIENSEIFLEAKRLLIVVRLGSGMWQIWFMIEEANASFRLMTPVAYIINEQITKLKQYCAVFIYPSLYKVLKLTFSWDSETLVACLLMVRFRLIMDLWLASSLKYEFHRMRHICDLQWLRVNVCCIQETRFSACDHEYPRGLTSTQDILRGVS